MPFLKNPMFLAVLSGVIVGCVIALNIILWDDDSIQTSSTDETITNPSNDSSAEVTSDQNAETIKVVEEAVTAGKETLTVALPSEAENGLESNRSEPSVIIPKFDVVRITPDGDTVIAGTAGSGQTIEILDGDRVIGTVKADDRGEWVFVPTDPLQPGNRQLSLRSINADSGLVVSDQIVMVVVPDRESMGEETIAVAASKKGDTPSQILQSPNNTSSAILSIDVIDYDDTGEFSLSGRATPDTLVNVYLDNAYIGTAQADKDGRWTLIPETRASPGQYNLRADQVDAKGEVLERINMPFMRDELTPEFGDGDFYVVQPGNSLWRIARQTYGEGLSYTLIYKANEEQIGDPDLIYPGQIFSLPEGGK